MTDTQRASFEKWQKENYKGIDYTFDEKHGYYQVRVALDYKIWLASSQVAQARIDELHTRLNEVATDWQVNQLKLTALEARNRELESALETCIIELQKQLQTDAPYNEYCDPPIEHAIDKSRKALLSTQPTDALDRFENEVIERCAKECWNKSDIFNIRSLKKEVK